MSLIISRNNSGHFPLLAIGQIFAARKVNQTPDDTSIGFHFLRVDCVHIREEQKIHYQLNSPSDIWSC